VKKMFKKKQNENAPEMAPFPDINSLASQPVMQPAVQVAAAPSPQTTQLRQMIQTRPQVFCDLIRIEDVEPQEGNELVRLTLITIKKNVKKKILTEVGRFTLGKVLVIQ
jgi:hypothetical protein